MKKIFNQKNFNNFFWSHLGSRGNIDLYFCLQVHYQVSAAWYCSNHWHRWQICRRCRWYRRQIATGVIDTGGKFAAGIVDTGDKFATGVNDWHNIRLQTPDSELEGKNIDLWIKGFFLSTRPQRLWNRKSPAPPPRPSQLRWSFQQYFWGQIMYQCDQTPKFFGFSFFYSFRIFSVCYSLLFRLSFSFSTI